MPNFNYFQYLTIAKNPPKITTINTANIHSGDVTHHHDQLATGPYSVSFNTRKIKNTTTGSENFMTLFIWFI
jgi:hypothetical protein